MPRRRTRRRSMSKEKSQKKHTVMRALLRFGIELSNGMHESIVSSIQAGTAKFLEKQSNRVSVFKVDAEVQPVAVAYDKKRGSIATMMPIEWFEKPDGTLEGRVKTEE